MRKPLRRKGSVLVVVVVLFAGPSLVFVQWALGHCSAEAICPPNRFVWCQTWGHCSSTYCRGEDGWGAFCQCGPDIIFLSCKPFHGPPG